MYNSQKYFENGSGHEVAASYSGLYEEGEVEHINVFGQFSYLNS